MNKIFVINKELGLTSRDVVNKLCKILGTKKIGHTGTLDPLATGVLVCLTGKYTKLVDLITAYEKEYIGTIKLGIKTDTLDITGKILSKSSDNYNLEQSEIIKVLNSFLGEYDQTVPSYSAVHINGKRAYEYARANIDVDLPKRKINIKEIELLNYDNSSITFRAVVSKGTYIRSLIQDICNKLGVIGTMSELIRTKQGQFSIDSSNTLDDIFNGNYINVDLSDVLKLEIVDVDDELYKKISNGNKLEFDYDGYILFKYNHKDIALYNFENKIGKLVILF